MQSSEQHRGGQNDHLNYSKRIVIVKGKLWRGGGTNNNPSEREATE